MWENLEGENFVIHHGEANGVENFGNSTSKSLAISLYF